MTLRSLAGFLLTVALLSPGSAFAGRIGPGQTGNDTADLVEQILADAGMPSGELLLLAKFEERTINGVVVEGCFNEASSSFCSFLTVTGMLNGNDGTFTYTGPETLVAYTVKGGNADPSWWTYVPMNGNVNEPWSTSGLLNGGGNQPGLSHLAFYGSPIPEPSSALAFVAGVAVVALAQRRRSA